MQHPAVREAAVFGIPSEKWGEVPLGAVVLKSGSSVTAEELRDWTNAKVAARYQQLKEILTIQSLLRVQTMEGDHGHAFSVGCRLDCGVGSIRASHRDGLQLFSQVN